MKFRSFAAALSVAACSGWAQSYTWTDVTPSVPNMRATAIVVQPIDGRVMVAMGAELGAGKLFISADRGSTWSPSINAPPTLADVQSLFANPGRPGQVFATELSWYSGCPSGCPNAGYTGRRFRTPDFGATWIQVPATVSMFATDPRNAGRLLAVEDEPFGIGQTNVISHLVESTDEGVSWSRVSSRNIGLPVAGPVRSAPARMFSTVYTIHTVFHVYASTTVEAFVSNDSGVTWAPVNHDPAIGFYWLQQDPHRGNVIYGLAGPVSDPTTVGLVRSDDGGVSWRSVLQLATAAFAQYPRLSIDEFRPDDIWLSGTLDNVYHSADGGLSWETVGGNVGPFAASFERFFTYAWPRVFLNPADSNVAYVISKGRLYRGTRIAKLDPQVVEYQYDEDRFWVAASQGEAYSQDYRMEPGHVRRTGIIWGAWRADDAPSGAVGSCRFWPRPETGLRTRVLVLQGFECEGLKRNPDWILEAENEFYAVPPVNGVCSNGLIPVRRFNNLQPDLNHRWVVDDATEARMLALGWYHEGVRFCSRPLGKGEQ